MKNTINWFEIPSANFERAVAFYSTILQATLRQETVGDTPNAILPYEGDAVGGAIIFSPRTKPSADGVLPYLNCDGVIAEVLSRVPAAGGRVVMPCATFPFGQIAIIQDTEGNHIGLHSN